MAVFSANRAAFTPSTTANNFTMLNAGANYYAHILAIGWGGRGTGSSSYRTRWFRPAGGGNGAGTQLTINKHSPGSATSGAAIYQNWTVSEPTPPADPANLFAIDWDVHGGNGVLMLPPGDGWTFCIGPAFDSSYFCCRNTQGTDANLSNYWVMWEE